jgi:AcrR family transcriptional regulator
VQRICARADVSQGALFRHFPSREALMVAVGEDIGAQMLERYRKRFLALPKGENDVVAAMKLVRDACRSRLNQAWYELAMAARTNDNLRKGLEPVGRRYYDDIARLARELLPDLAEKLGESFEVLVATIIAVFDGEVVHRFVLKDERTEDARMTVLASLVALVAPPSRER